MLAGVLLVSGVAVKLGCLGADGLTRGEAALGWCYSDVVALAQARDLAGTPLPYREVMTEYPPGTALQWLIAGALSRNATGFYLVTAAIQVAAWLGCVRLLVAEGLPARHLLVVSAVPALVFTATINWDAVAVLALTAGLVAARRGRAVLAGAALGLGGLVKAFPLLAVGALAVSWWRRGDGRAAWHVMAPALAVVAVVQLPVAVWAPEGWDAWLTLNADRAVDWDTLWYGLQVVIGQPLPPGAANVLVTTAVVVGWAGITWMGTRRGVGDEALVLALLTWLLVAGKVYSPQFSLWLLPLLALARIDVRLVAAWALADVTLVLTRFPFLAGQQGLEPSLPYEPFGIAVAVRAVLMVGLVVVALQPPAARPSHPVAAPR